MKTSSPKAKKPQPQRRKSAQKSAVERIKTWAATTPPPEQFFPRAVVGQITVADLLQDAIDIGAGISMQLVDSKLQKTRFAFRYCNKHFLADITPMQQGSKYHE